MPLVILFGQLPIDSIRFIDQPPTLPLTRDLDLGGWRLKSKRFLGLGEMPPRKILVDGGVVRPYRFLHYFNGELGEYKHFIRECNILNEFLVRRGPNRHQDVLYRNDELTFPLMVIIEEGIRFSLDLFVRQVLRTLTLSSPQLSVNSYRVIMSIAKLRQTEGLLFGV